MIRKIISSIIIFCFSFSLIVPSKSYANGVLGLPEAGAMVNLSQAYEPVTIKGLKIHRNNPFLFDFIMDIGQDQLAGESLKQEGERLIKYFLASLAIPEKDLWVNLSPYEKNRIIPDALGQTDMGRDLLAQDYLLKQITASLIYPEKQLGKTFWDKVYAKSQQMYGTTQIPVNTFNKVWIIADRAEVFEHNQTAFVVDSHLKVMLEEDYLAMSKNGMPTRGHVPEGAASPSRLPSETGLDAKATQRNKASELSSQIIREIVLPELEKEVNSGKNFASLRQIFNAIILSSWYKKNLKQALLNQVYADQSKVKGIDLNDANIKQQIYEQYLKAYKKGVFNYIKDPDPTDVGSGATSAGPRKYFSGGILAAGAAANPHTTTDAAMLSRSLTGKTLVSFETGMDQKAPTLSQDQGDREDAAMSARSLDELRREPILWDEETSLLDSVDGKGLVGGKSYQAAKYWHDDPNNNLRSFSGTATAAIEFLSSDPKLLPEIYRITQEMDAADEKAREEAGVKIRELISNTPIPPAIEQALREGYRRLVQITEQPVVAVRSSGKAEDISLNIPELAGINLGANAGQHDTYLGESGEEAVVKRWRDCIASLYTARVLGYRDSMMVFSAFGKILPKKQLTADIVAKLKQGNEEDKLVARAIQGADGRPNIMIISSLKLLRALERNGFNEAAALVNEAKDDFTKIDNIAMGVTIMPMAGVDISFVAFGHEMTSSWTAMDFQKIPEAEHLNKGRVVTVTTTYGIGESIVQGVTMPDTFLVHVFEDENGEHVNILSRSVGTKTVQAVYVASVLQALEIDEQAVGLFLDLLKSKDTSQFFIKNKDEKNIYEKMHIKNNAEFFIIKDVLERLIDKKVDETASINISENELAQFKYDREQINKLAHLLKALLKDPKIKTIFTDVPAQLRGQFSATDEQVGKIAREFLKKAKGYNHLVDMEGAVGKNFSRSNTAVTVQRRPSNVDGDVKEPQKIKINYTYVRTKDVDDIRSEKRRIHTKKDQLSNLFVGDQLVQGIPTRNSFSGEIYKIDESKDLTAQFEEIKQLADQGHKIIIRTNETTPDYIDVLKYRNVMGVIASSGGATSHAAVVSRELGIATVVGIQSWLDKLVDSVGATKAHEIADYLETSGSIVTVDANAGEETGVGTVYAGELPVSTRDIEIDLKRLPKLFTPIAYIMGMPHPMIAMSKMSQYEGYYGVALMRGEFAYAEENVNPRAGRAYDLLLVDLYLKSSRNSAKSKAFYKSLTVVERQALEKFRAYLDRRVELRRQGQNLPLDVTEELIERFKDRRSGDAFLKSRSTYEQTDIELLKNDSEELNKLTKQIGGYVSYNEFFDAVHGGAVGTMAAANSQTDNTVVYRSIDFKKNEAAELIGSKVFDPVPEAATMVGERGARWLLKPENKVILVEEIRMLLRQVKRGYSNIGFMFPFVSTPEELDQLLTILEQEEKSFSEKEGKPIYLREVGQMVELPSNVVQAEDFIKVLKRHENGIKRWFKTNYNVEINRKGFLSFGTNDLTQLTLGADRDNPKMRSLFNEAHRFVVESIRHVVSMAKKYGIKCGLCGQALVNLVNVDPEKAEEILMLLGSTGGYAGTDYLGTVAAITRSASATLKHGKIEDSVVASAETVLRNFEATLNKGAAARPLYQVTTKEDLAKSYVGDFVFLHDGILSQYDSKDDKLKEQLARLGAILYSDETQTQTVLEISKKLRVPAIKVSTGAESLAAIANGEMITIDFSRQTIYKNQLDVEIDLPEIESKVNVGAKHHEVTSIEFDQTFKVADMYRDLKVYPQAFLAYDDANKRQLLGKETREEIERLIRAIEVQSATDVLRHEISSRLLAKMQSPNAKLVYQTLDIQSDDLAKLLGHKELGLQEEVNPPLGFNGLEALMGDDQLKELFTIEMKVIKELIDRGHDIYIQFNSIKTPDSLQQAIQVLKSVGIRPEDNKIGMNTAWPGNYLFLQDFLGKGLAFVTVDERNLAKAYLAADLYKNRKVQDAYPWEKIADNVDITKRMIEEAIVDFSSRKWPVSIQLVNFGSTTDAAMASAPVKKPTLSTSVRKEENLGGIDLNTTGMGWTIRQDGNGVQMDVDPVMLEKVKREGVNSLTPIIFRITPVTNIWPLIGMQEPAKEAEDRYAHV